MNRFYLNVVLKTQNYVKRFVKKWLKSYKKIFFMKKRYHKTFLC